ncbi:hypothetical protein ACFWBM_35185 [Streptomyces sp. NPDC059980]|uniref:hypothetical protein n=1 Tax=Streptomyces sp. NPDC059980 TaxID=3347022 RepID=UPI00367909D4
MRHESIPGRRGALWGASAAVLCLGGVLAACGSGGAGGGYVAVGPGGGPPGGSGAAVAPSDDVSLVPLDGSGKRDSGAAGAKSGDGRAGSGADGSTASGSGPGDTKKAGGAKAGAGSGGTGAGAGGTGSDASSGSDSDGTGGSSGGGPGAGAGGGAGQPSAPVTPAPSASARPAALGVTDTRRAATDHRWCEKVTVSFRNTGGTAVRSGTVTFGTHIIGSLGIDWATITSAEALPAPIAAGARKDGTWTVCVDAWRVPLGMHIETRDVSVQWK